MAKKLSLVHVISALPFGGVEQNLLRVLPIIKESGFDVSVVCTREKGDMAPLVEEAGIPVDFVPFRTRYDPGSLLRLKKYFTERKCDIIHCHMRRANTSGRIAAMLAGVPVRVVTEHDMCLGKKWQHYIVDRLLAPFTDVILGVTKAVVELNSERSGIPAEKFNAMYLGLELDKLAKQPTREEARKTLGLDQNTRIIGHVGRMHKIKNIDMIVRAMAEEPMREAQLLLIGDGPERADIERIVAELNLQERVIFAGWQTDLPMVYAAMDAQVMASSSEGIATVQMESLATGVPLVSTPVGFAAELLEAGKQFVEVARPEPGLLAIGMAEVLDPARGEQLRTEGYEAIKDFSIERQAEKWIELYRDLARKHGLDFA